MEYTLIANSGIQLFTLKLKFDTRDKFRLWFHEWYDKENSEWKLELLHEVTTDDSRFYYRKKDLWAKGYLASAAVTIDPSELRHDGVVPLMVDGETEPGVEGEIFSLSFSDRDLRLDSLVGKWLPVPYFMRRTASKFNFGPLNWVRMKLEPAGEGEENAGCYNAILAFDTRVTYSSPSHDDQGRKIFHEHPVFPDNYANEIDLALCDNELLLLDYCSAGHDWSFVDSYLFSLVHPGLSRIEQIRGEKKKMLYGASYIFLMAYLGAHRLLPDIKLYKDTDVESREVDMVVDIGNSKTTALLIEDNRSFNQVRPLALVDLTDPISVDEEGNVGVRTFDEAFDMRLVFRKADFGSFGRKDSRQFVYPSLVRLGQEANDLIHLAAVTEEGLQSLSTNSSPKRYLWDGRPSKEEWRFMVMPGENADHVLQLNGISEYLRSDGTFDPEGHGNRTYHYSRRSLMTFAFLEMLVQAHAQLNGIRHRSFENGLGHPGKPRRIKRIIITCPTAMSKVEREALVRCAKDAVSLFSRFYGKSDEGGKPYIEVVPPVTSLRDNDTNWYYDEATCSQLVYMYGEVGHKYKGAGSEFFRLYGRKSPGDDRETITVGSLDIGAGTSDLMINKYSYETADITTLTPDPLFYDSFYYAGDDMLHGLIKNVMLLNDTSAFRQELSGLSQREYRQKIKDFFGPDHNDQSLADRVLRRDFNIQYSIPLMSWFLQLLAENHKDCVVRYDDVFSQSPVNINVIEGFKAKMGIDIRTLQWRFDSAFVSDIIEKEFEPLLKKIATIMYSYACDIILLSGRPASLPPIRRIFLKYYPVSPDRLILLNNYYVGDWYPFSNNTGYIANPKTIVAMGGVIGHYASELSNLNRFVINLDRLKNGLKSTVNYFEASREGAPKEYFLSPEKSSGSLVVSRLPEFITVRQIGLESYPGRTLYTIDFNRHRIAEAITRKAIAAGQPMIPESKLHSMVNEEVEALRKRMPFRLGIERDPENKEQISVSSIEDKDGNEISENYVEINIQSLGANEKYWLDSGAFNF